VWAHPVTFDTSGEMTYRRSQRSLEVLESLVEITRW
jgi:hypothetical protein